MAELRDLGKWESSEDDSISLTSTIVSDGDGLEYAVDRILAEWETDGVKSYLTKWDGYPEERSTWQLRDTFNPGEAGGHDVFKEWQERKMRIARGYEKPYDIDDFERRQAKLEKEVNDRKARRRRKKARLNRIVDALPSDSDSDSDSGETSDGTSEGFQSKVEACRSSGSNSEGNEAQPMARENSSSAQTINPWTDTEKQMLLRGLQDANGAAWNQILARYGHRGTVNQVLKDRTPKDLQQQLQTLRQEFEDAGRDPPAYLNATRLQTATKQSSRPKLQSTYESNATSTDKSTSSDEQTSTGSMMEEIEINENSRARDGAPTSIRPKQEASDPKQLTNIPVNHRRTESTPTGITQQAVPNPEQASSTTTHGSVAGASRPESTNQSSFRTTIPKKLYSGTARAPVSKPSESGGASNRGRAGASSIGPASLSAPRPGKKIGKPTSKVRMSGVDVTANWSGEPKRRKARTLPTTNTAASNERPIKVFKTLGARNSVQKWRRNEPAPDPAQLVFVDPKTGRAPKRSHFISATNEGNVSSSESPYRMYQKELAAKEANNWPQEKDNPEVNEDEDALFVDNGELGVVGRTNSIGANASAPSPLNRTSVIVDSNADIQPSPQRSINPAPPPNAPAGPRVHLAASLQPDIRRPRSDVTQFSSMVGTGGLRHQHTLRPSESSTLMLGGKSTPQEKKELFFRLEPDLVLGDFRTGPTLEVVGKIKLAGFSRDVQRVLLTIKDRNDPEHLYFDFDKVCAAADYAKYWHNDATTYIGSGHVVPYRDTQIQYDSIANLLAVHMSAGLFFARDFTMVIWPTRSSVWAFLENNLPPVPAGAVLRFALRESMREHRIRQVEPAMTTRLRHEDAKAYDEIATTVTNIPIQPGEKHINLVFRELFGIEFDRLLPANGPQRPPPGKNFFLCFVPAGCEQYEPDEAKRYALRWKTSEEHDLFVQFLQANGAESIYSMQDVGSYEATHNGSWRHFIENVKSGAIIIHERCGRPDQLPYLARFLSSREGGINVWMTSLSSMEREGESHPHLIRYFPHGGVILLTVSLMLYRPYEAFRILRWFRLYQLPAKYSGTWKVAVRPRIREWLLDLHDLCCEKSRKSPFGDFTLQVYADIYTEISLLLERDKEPFGLLVEKWDTEVPLAEAPVVAEIRLPRSHREWAGTTFETVEIDHKAVRWNDEELIQWFSEWAGTRLHDHRKFHVVLGYPKGDKEGDYVTKCYEKGYGYLDDGPDGPGRQSRGLFKRVNGTEIRAAWERNFLEILSYDRFFVRHKIPDQATLDKKGTACRQKEKAALIRLKAEAEAAWREERRAARKALQTIMQIWRDEGAAEEQARAAGRQHLIWRRDEQGTASHKEVADCAIDMEWKPFNRYACTIARTEEEQEVALKALKDEEKRLADKERLSGTKEWECMWEREIQKWAVRDRTRSLAERANTFSDDIDMSDALKAGNSF